MNVAIIGGGINGYCCAIQILEYLQNTKAAASVTIISDDFSPNTTGDGSAGLWGPYLLGGTPTVKVHQWSKSMHKFLEQIWLSEDAGDAGVCLIPVVRVTTTSEPVDNFWKDIVYGCTPFTQEQLREFNLGKEKQYSSGFHFVTYTSEPAKLLPYLMRRFEANGGKTIQQKVDSLEDFIGNSKYDAIINCTGLGAKELLNDKQMYPIRGQVSRVKANWMFYVILDESDDGNYIIPNLNSVVLGGTHQKDNFNIAVSRKDKEFIENGCKRIVPGLAHAQHLCDWVGLRPGRVALIVDVNSQSDKIIINNYGHGGSGVTLAWGCAEDVVQLLDAAIMKRNLYKSKL